MRGDTDFSQTEHLDRWEDRPQVRFIFGIDAMPNLVTLTSRLRRLPLRSWYGRHDERSPLETKKAAAA